VAFLDTVSKMFGRQENIEGAEGAEGASGANGSSFVDTQIDEAKVAADIKKEWEKRREARVTRELQWQLNREFLSGNQYCDINTVSRSIDEIPFIYDDEEREVFNLIAPKVETRLAKLNKAKPALMVRPASESHKDISTAKVSTKVVRGVYNDIDKIGMQEYFKTVNAWSEVVGTVFHKSVWDPNIGRVLADDGSGQLVREGDVTHYVAPAFEIYPESEYIEHVEAQGSMIHAKPYTVVEIENIYGIKVKGRSVDVYNLENSRISTGGLGYTASVQRYVKGQVEDSEVVIECYYKPCKKYPKGKLITVIGDKVPVYMDLPWVDNYGVPYYPFTKQVCIREAGCFWGKTIIERLVPVQRRFNALKNRIHEYINMTAVPAWTMEQDSLVNKEDLQANGIRAGDVIERIPGSSPPTALQMPNIQYEVLNEDARLRDLFTEISGVSDFASQSAAPAGTPGVGMELIKQQDDSRVSLTSENIEIAAKSLGKKWLWLYRQFVKAPRMTKVVGDDHSLPYIIEWTENDLTSYDVVLETEDLLTTSVAQKRQQVIFLLSQGLFHDPVTGQLIPSMRAKLFEMFELGNWEDAVSLENIHIRRANEENMYFKRNMIPQINPLDQDDLHVREHTRFALTTEFEDLAKVNPMLRQYMFEHISMHHMMQTQKAGMGQLGMPQPQTVQQGATPPAQVRAPNGGDIYGRPTAMAI